MKKVNDVISVITQHNLRLCLASRLMLETISLTPFEKVSNPFGRPTWQIPKVSPLGAVSGLQLTLIKRLGPLGLDM